MILRIIDFETTGLKPDAPVQEIVSCSISQCDASAYSFDMPTSGPAFTRLQKVMADPRIKKRAHNAKFEDRWAYAAGMPVVNWEWCSMLAAHQLDNRSAVCSLKFQVYVQFGVADYDSHISDYLKSAEDGAYAINTIKQAPRRDRLVYNGLDTIFQYRLTELQMKAIRAGVYR